MIELFDMKPDVNVPESEYKRLLGYPNQYELNGKARELADWARQWYTENGNPWLYARQAGELELGNGQLQINGTEFLHGQLHNRLVNSQAHTAVLVAVSAGKQCEEKARQLWQEQKPDEYFFLEIYGSAVVEHLIMSVGARLCAWAEENGMAVLPHYSPGYPGWDISDQNRLLNLIQQGKSHDFPGEITVLETGMLRPKKSLLAVFGITKHRDKVKSLAELVPCENCSLQSCQYRRVPYKHALDQIENVRQLQPGDDKTNGKILHKSSLANSARYTINNRALQKWGQDRLRIKILDNQSVEASFRYEGTTCSNLGHRLEYDYFIKLDSSEEDYKILEMTCNPAPGDTGHTFMCQYIGNPEILEQTIATEKPLLGRPLSEVFSWQREYSPAGCYCDSESRLHKWGLVLEVLHYALAHRGEQIINTKEQDTAIVEYQ